MLPCECSKVDFQEKVATLLDAVVALLGEEKPEVLQVRGGGEGGRGVLQLNRGQDGQRSLKEGQGDATNVQQGCNVGCERLSGPVPPTIRLPTGTLQQ